MIKLKQILLEGEVEAITQKFSPKNYNIILKYLKDAYVFPNQLLYRRISDDIDVDIRKIRKDRQLRDTDEFMYEFGKVVLNFYGKNEIIPKREESLYAYSIDDIDLSYGENLTVVFPKNTCTVVYNQKFKDSYITYNIKYLYSAKDLRYLTFAQKNKLINLSRFFKAFQNYEKIKYIDDSSFNKIQKYLLLINVDKLKEEIETAKNIIKKLERKIETGQSKYDKYLWVINFKVVLSGIKENLDKIMEYESGLQILKNGEPLPYGEFEIVITGDEYLIADYELFINTFEWSNKLKTWVLKGS